MADMTIDQVKNNFKNAVYGKDVRAALVAMADLVGEDIDTVDDLTSLVSKDLADVFDTNTAYDIGDYVVYGDKLYRFIAAHDAGAWNSSEATAVSIGNEILSISSTLNDTDAALFGSAVSDVDILTDVDFVNRTSNIDWDEQWYAYNRASNLYDPIIVKQYDFISVVPASGYYYIVLFYSLDKINVDSGYGTSWRSGQTLYSVPGDAVYMRINFRKADDTEISTSTIKEYYTVTGERKASIKNKTELVDIIGAAQYHHLGETQIDLINDVCQVYNKYSLLFGNIVSGNITYGGNNRIILNNHYPIETLDIARIVIRTTKYVNAYVYLYKSDKSYYQYNIQQNTGDNGDNVFEIIFPEWNFTEDAKYINICFRKYDGTAFSSTNDIVDNVEIIVYKHQRQQENVDINTYWKNWLVNKLRHTYYTGSNIQAHYLGFTKPIVVPVYLKIKLPDNKYTRIVRYYNYNPDGTTKEDGTTGWLSTGDVSIMPGATVMLTVQWGPSSASKGSNYITYDELYEDIEVVVEPQLVRLTREQFIPYLLTNNYTNEHRFCLMHFSDSHKNENIVKEMINYYNFYSSEISGCIDTGDLVSDDSTEGFAFWSNIGADNIMTCIGNHDAKHTENGTVTWLTEKEKYSMYFEPFIDKWGVQYVQNRTWYYKIYSSEGIVLLVYDSMVTDVNAEEMYAFIKNVLDVALTNNYSVIMAEHFSMSNSNGEKIECAFTGEGGIFDELVDGFSIQNRTHSLVKNFTDAGGDFICFLTGHLHSNILSYHKDFNQLNVSIASAGYWQGVQSNDTIRIQHTKSQYEFNLIYVCRAKHTITIQRVGADKDRYGRKIDAITLNYRTMERISG